MKIDVVVIGGGRAGYGEAVKAVGQSRSCALVTEGRSLDRLDYRDFVRSGGILMEGDRIESVSGCRAVTSNGVRLEADEFVLAAGRFFSRGLVCDMDSVREPVFGLDLDFPEDRSLWFADDFFAPQPFADFGVVLKDGHPTVSGRPIMNVRVVGTILSKVYRNAE